ncbi:MAG: NAD(P)-dependent oxidoreductase [Thermoleophilaceae bacterium]|nr:NAD(P)-dependent oxidoreductase [Thermoleophilaceae bacterium]
MERIERVAFIGLGIMGSRMAANLCRAGFEVHAFNRTRARSEELAERHGAHVADTPREAAAAAQATVTMVVDSPDVEQVLLGEDGAAHGMSAGHLAIDCSTISPEASRSIGARLRERGVGFLDAPVTGSSPRAEDGTLTIMVGGERADYERALPVLEAMGLLVVYAGPQGQGSMVKLINNAVAAANAAALAEALVLAERAGVDTDALVRVMAAGSGDSAMLALKARPMLERDFSPLFKLDHMLKDVRHTLAAARAAGVELPLGERIERLYAEASERGHGSDDFAAVVEALDREMRPISR